MAFGLEVYNESNALNFTTEKRLTHKLGQFVPSTRSGSFVVPAGIGDVWACHNIIGVGTRSDGIGVWVEGDTVRWQMYFYKVTDRPLILYGRYSK